MGLGVSTNSHPENESAFHLTQCFHSRFIRLINPLHLLILQFFTFKPASPHQLKSPTTTELTDKSLDIINLCTPHDRSRDKTFLFLDQAKAT